MTHAGTTTPSREIATLLSQRSGTTVLPIFLDGGFATQCERVGVDLNHPMWSTKALIDDPATVTAVHEAFFLAGADVASTCTYQASQAMASFLGLDLDALAAGALRAASRARGGPFEPNKPRVVAASLGPYGATLAGGHEFTGNYTESPEFYAAFHLPRLQALLVPRQGEGGDPATTPPPPPPPGLLLLETFPRLDEALAALGVVARLYAAGEVPSDRQVPVSVSFTLRAHDAEAGGGVPSPRVVTAGGDDFTEVVHAIGPFFPFVRWIGANCSLPHSVTRMLAQLSADGVLRPGAPYWTPVWAGVPRGIVVYPNSGEKWVATVAGTGTWSAAHVPEAEGRIGGRLVSYWPAWQPLIASAFGIDREAPSLGHGQRSLLIGGCCRTYPEDITELRTAVEGTSW